MKGFVWGVVWICVAAGAWGVAAAESQSETGITPGFRSSPAANRDRHIMARETRTKLVELQKQAEMLSRGLPASGHETSVTAEQARIICELKTRFDAASRGVDAKLLELGKPVALRMQGLRDDREHAESSFEHTQKAMEQQMDLMTSIVKTMQQERNALKQQK